MRKKSNTNNFPSCLNNSFLGVASSCSHANEKSLVSGKSLCDGAKTSLSQNCLRMRAT